MKNTTSFIKNILTLLGVAISFFLLFDHFADGLKKEQKSIVQSPGSPSKMTDIQLTAIGDSLTQGVGDGSQRGGYVTLTAENLRRSDLIGKVSTLNFGKSGNTTVQIIKRIDEMKEIQSGIQNAQVLVVSAGGNDLIHAIRKSGFQVNVEQAEKDLQTYEKNLDMLIQKMRVHNPSAPLFLFGLYNPYEKELGDVPYLQELLNQWNESTQKAAETEGNSYFVPISDLFSRPGVTVSGEMAEEPENAPHPYLFQDDYFHPNEKGYQLMADELTKEILPVIQNNEGGTENES